MNTAKNRIDPNWQTQIKVTLSSPKSDNGKGGKEEIDNDLKQVYINANLLRILRI